MTGYDRKGFIDLSLLLQSSKRVRESGIVASLVHTHSALLEASKSGSVQAPSIRDLQQTLSLYKHLKDSGCEASSAIRTAYSQVHPLLELSVTKSAKHIRLLFVFPVFCSN